MINKVKRLVHLLFVGLLTAVPLLAAQPVYAASASMSLSPASSSVSQGSTFSVSVREDSGSEPVNAAKVFLNYPTDKLDFVSISSSSAFAVVAASSGGGGTVNIQRGANPAVTGAQTVASVKFKAKVATGTAAITFASGSVVVSSNSNQDVPTSTTGGNYTFKPAPPPATKDTIPPAITEVSATESTFNGATISWKTSEPATSEVNYGLTTTYGLVAADTNLVTDHKVVLSSDLLAAGTIYHYIVKSTDGAGNTVASADQTFSTKGVDLDVTVVNQKNKPVEGAVVTVAEKSGTTAKNGKVKLSGLPVGEHAGTVEYKGKKTTVSVDIKNTDPAAVTFKITTPTNQLIWLLLAGLLVLLLAAGTVFIRRRNKGQGPPPAMTPPPPPAPVAPTSSPGISGPSYKPPEETSSLFHPTPTSPAETFSSSKPSTSAPTSSELHTDEPVEVQAASTPVTQERKVKIS